MIWNTIRDNKNYRICKLLFDSNNADISMFGTNETLPFRLILSDKSTF